MIPYTLLDFVRESNRIEGIHREPLPEEILAHFAVLGKERLSVMDLCEFVGRVQPGAVVRSREGLNVRVGSHVAPQGGPEVVRVLETILERASRTRTARAAFYLHHEYERLHPFTDGNGRSGRALWLWMMGGIERVPLGFLHTWYYASLEVG